jgi:serine phosphatase RsbU (regulator of sigma subunit)
VLVDPAGTVAGVSAAAEPLFADAVGAPFHEAVPGWLANAHRRLGRPHRGGGAIEPSRGWIGDRCFRAYPAGADDGSVTWWLVDDTQQSRAEAALARERDRFALLVETSDELLTSLNVERCRATTARLAARHFAEAAVVISPAAGRRFDVTTAGAGAAVTHSTVDADLASDPGLDEALRGYPPAPPRRLDPAVVPAALIPSEVADKLDSAVIVPLPGHGMPAGALLLFQPPSPPAGDLDETLLWLFATRAGAALSAASMYSEQANTTRTLMQDLLPPPLHPVDGVEFAGGYRAASDRERVSGDFYDLHHGSTPSQEPLVVLGDVCGKGLDAAVLSGRIRTTLQALLPMADDHRRVLQLLNGTLLNSRHTQFATLVLASASRSGQRVRLRLTAAGHPAPLIVRADGQVEATDTRGTLIGVLPTVSTSTTSVELGPGETCVLYTDGVTEARGGPLGRERFGEQRLRDALADCAGMTAEAVVERIQVLASDWIGDSSHDDMALVAITAPRSTDADRQYGPAGS